MSSSPMTFDVALSQLKKKKKKLHKTEGLSKVAQ